MRCVDINNEELDSHLSSPNVCDSDPDPYIPVRINSRNLIVVHTAALWNITTKSVHRNRLARDSGYLGGLPVGA